jgi:hypothetical protein
MMNYCDDSLKYREVFEFFERIKYTINRTLFRHMEQHEAFFIVITLLKVRLDDIETAVPNKWGDL